MALLSTNLNLTATQALAAGSGTTSGKTASVSGGLVATASHQDTTSAVQATAHANADAIQVTAAGNATASGGSASANITLVAHVDPNAETVAVGAATANADAKATQDGIASSAALASTQADTNDTHLTSSGNAASSGEAASALVTIGASIDQQPGVFVVDVASADATGTGVVIPLAMANTDAAATGDDLVISKEQETMMTDANHPVVLSVTYLQGVQAGPEATATDPVMSSADVANLQMDVISVNGELGIPGAVPFAG
jgi:hypothetical protein